MMTICQTCGDRGFSNALIFCHECQVYAVHRYCLDVLPATFDEYVVWLCEDCESKTLQLSFPDERSPFQVRENDFESFGSVQVKKKKNVKKKLKKKSKRKDNTQRGNSAVIGHGKSSSLQPQEVHCSENSERDQEFVRQDVLNDCNFDEAVESLQSKNSQLDLGDFKPVEMSCCEDGEIDEKHGRQDLLGEADFLEEGEFLKTEKSLVAVPLKASSLYEEINQKLVRQNILHDDFVYEDAKRLNGLNKRCVHEDSNPPKINDNQLARFDIHPLAVDYSMDGEKDNNLGRWNNLDEGSCCEEAEPENRQLVICDPSNILEQNFAVRAQPIIDQIWRGSLSVLGKHFGTVGLVAHLSNLAGSSVYEEAKSFPTLLSPELRPRSAIWPKSFANKGPSDENIALFFFPDNDRNEKKYDSLVNDMIHHDRAMRAVLQNAELLIFTSTTLPIDFWRFKAKFFLWGVFKGKQPLRKAGDAASVEEKSLVKTLTCDRHKSPVSPLSNGSYGCGSISSALCPSTL
ncbi:uncharacterized protein LOC105629137 isoform X2 [Jatropha curcas]|uniref:uncharacterized protein LOC105629137 isoform X2 n=1 Tax=Jatropha curcas TaxID=180498 RepID=UPI0005FC1D39|nr:uncharacterized protein LOC105629137 isoform X2 [Jatropha curcas]